VTLLDDGGVLIGGGCGEEIRMVGGDIFLSCPGDVFMEAGRNINMKTIGGRCQMDIGTDWKVTVGLDNKITIGQNWEQVVGAASKITTVSGLDVNTGGDNKFSAAGSTHIASGGRHYETATRIDMNGPSAVIATAAQAITPLPVYPNPSTNPATGWAQSKYQDGTITSIMKRIPMHEPWLLHENQAPQLLTPDQTDREKE
jgi:hypothetical protein